MTIPCERTDDIKEIKDDMRELKVDVKAIMKHQYENTIDIVKLKSASAKTGGIWGAVASIIIALASIISAKAGF